jgi:hypothetical protein
MSQDNTSRPQRRIIVPEKVEKVQPSSISIIPDAPTLIQDALSVIATEIVKYKAKVSGGKSLDLNEGRLLNNYIKSLCELSRESREREADMDWASMSDTDILALVEKLRNRGSQNNSNKNTEIQTKQEEEQDNE